MQARSAALLVGSTLLLCAAPAAADIAPTPPAGKSFAAHYLVIENVADHPGFAFVVYDETKDEQIRASRVFKAGSKNELLLADGGNWRSSGQFGNPGIWLLTAKQEQAWSLATQASIDKQYEACAERGEGCAHISRFVPRYAIPKKAIDCGVRIHIQTVVEEGGNTRIVDRYRIVEVSAKACRLERLNTTARAVDTGADAQDEAQAELQPASALGCAALGDTPGPLPLALAAAVILLGAAARRRSRR